MKTICYLLLALIFAVLVLAVTGCEIAYSNGSWTASPNGVEIARAIRVIAEK